MQDGAARLAAALALVAAAAGAVRGGDERVEGTKNSNLHQGQRGVAAAVDGFMDDSDPSNADKVGHRRWLLNPALKRIGVGEVDGFVAVWATDKSRGMFERPELIAFPGHGHYPASLLRPHFVWSAAYHDGLVSLPDRPAVKLTLLGPDYEREEELAVKDVRLIKQDTIGLKPILLFTPSLQSVHLRPGRRLLVEVEGATDLQRRPRPFLWVVDLF